MEESQIVALINCNKFVDLKTAFKTVKAYERFFARYQDKIDWYVASRYLYLSPKIISRYSYKIDFEKLSANKFLQEKTIIRYAGKLNWAMLSYNPCLSEDFIRKFQDKVCWVHISYHQKLSEKFIEEFSHKVDWTAISKTQNISLDFIRKNKKHIWFSGLAENKYFNFTDAFIKEFADQLDLNDLIYKNLFSFELLKEFHEKIYLPSAFRRMRVSSAFIKKCCFNMDLSFFPLCFFNINHLDSWKTFL